MLKHSTIRQNLVKQINSEILKGKYKPGERINETEIAHKYSISRGPVREALRQLEQDGLVEYKNNRGCYVADLTIDEIWELYCLRAELEGIAIDWLDDGICDNSIEKMQTCVNDMKIAADEDNRSAVLEADHDFHEAIIQAPERKTIYQLWTSMDKRTGVLYLKVLASNIKSLHAVHLFHQELLDIIKQNDNVRTKKAIKDHYMETGMKLIKKVKESS
jgi:DNA-binding GntR family transcriptional regulator